MMMFSSVTNAMPTLDMALATEVKAEEVVEVDTKDMTTEEFVRNYFADIPVMIEIARCESQFRQTVNGETLRGNAVPADRGVMQINEHYHLETAKKLGFDIYTLEGNVAYARYLFETQGTRPWRPSAKCWGGKYPEHYELAMK